MSMQAKSDAAHETSPASGGIAPAGFAKAGQADGGATDVEIKRPPKEQRIYRLTGTPGQGLIGATLGFFIGFAAVALFGPTASKFNEVMKLSPVMIGFLVAMPSLSGSLLRIPFSAWVDITGGRKPFLVLLGLACVGMLALTMVVWLAYPTRLSTAMYPLLLVLGLLCGAGIATFSVGISQVSYWFPRARQGSALGVYAGVGNLAPGIFSFLLPLALGTLGLSGSYLAWSVFLIAGTLLYFLLGRNSWYFQLRAQGYAPDEAREVAQAHGQEAFPAGNVMESLQRSARIWKTWCLVAIYFTTFGGFMGLTSWLPTYWKNFFAADVVLAGSLAGLFSILASLSRVAGGSLSDRLGGENTVLLALGTALVGAVAISASHSPGLSIAGEIIMAVGMGVSNAAVFKLVPQYVPNAIGGASGWVGGLGALGGFVFPPLLGAMVTWMGQPGYGDGFVVFCAFFLVSLALSAWLKRAGRRTG